MSKKSNKSLVEIKELSESDLQKLAHEGTKEAIEKIEKYIKLEKDLEKRSYAEMALGEAEKFCFLDQKARKLLSFLTEN